MTRFLLAGTFLKVSLNSQQHRFLRKKILLLFAATWPFRMSAWDRKLVLINVGSAKRIRIII